MSAESNPDIQRLCREPQAISSWNLVATFGFANVLDAFCIHFSDPEGWADSAAYGGKEVPPERIWGEDPLHLL